MFVKFKIMATLAEKQNDYFKFNKELSPFTNKQWSRGGQTSNGLRRAGEVINYFYGAGRQNIIPDASQKQDLDTNNPSFKEPVSSIGWLQNNGLGQVASGRYGNGTLLSTNTQVTNPVIRNSEQQGYVLQNDKREQFVNYRNIDPSLVENLRHNPLSIYVVNESKDTPVPAFFSFVKPENYNTYNTLPGADISEQTKQSVINGSPQANILGLGTQNPLMGITTGIPNQTPIYSGKTYGGHNNSNARPYADQLYDSIWTSNEGQPSVKLPHMPSGLPEGERFVNNFDNTKCQNKALAFAAQGYNVSPQINENRKLEWVGGGAHGVTNLPWGPIKVTGNPWTQQGGIWQKGGNQWPTMPTAYGYQSTKDKSQEGGFTLPNYQNKNIFMYQNGLPGSLIMN